MSYLPIEVRWPKPKVAGDYIALEPGKPHPCYVCIRRNGFGGLDISTGALTGSLDSLSDEWKFSLPIVISSTLSEEERKAFESKRHLALQKETIERLKISSEKLKISRPRMVENIKIPSLSVPKKIPKKLIDYCRKDVVDKELERNGASWASKRSR